MFGLLYLWRHIVAWLRSVFRPRSLATGTVHVDRLDPTGLFEPDRGPDERPHIDGDDAVWRAWTAPNYMPEMPGTPLEAKLQKLRRAAIFDIFEQLGLAVVPSQVWNFIDHADDVSIGLGSFFEKTGCDPKSLKDRNPEEIKRANVMLELLVDVASSCAHLPHSAKARIAERLYSGNYDAVREAAEAVAAFERIHRVSVSDAWSPDQHLGLFTAFLEEISKGLNDPVSVSSEDVANARAASNQIIKLMVRFNAAASDYESIMAELAMEWPDAWRTGPEADELNTDVEFFQTLKKSLRVETSSTLAEVSEAIDELEICSKRLNDLLAAARLFAAGGTGRAHSGSSGSSGASGGMGIRDHALVFFGFAPGSNPTIIAIKKKWTAFMRVHHPDVGGELTAAELKRRTDLTAQANVYKDILCGV